MKPEPRKVRCQRLNTSYVKFNVLRVYQDEPEFLKIIAGTRLSLCSRRFTLVHMSLTNATYVPRVLRSNHNLFKTGSHLKGPR